MDLGLKDKVALITGSSRGLGLASARSLAAEGCRVMLSARGAEQLVISEAAVRGVALAPEAVASVAADLATAEGIARAVEETVARFGGRQKTLTAGSTDGEGRTNTAKPVRQSGTSPAAQRCGR